MSKRKLLPSIGLILGIPISLVGLIFIYMYINSAIIERWGEGDQSLLFWYVPILFIGIIVTGAGLTSCLLAGIALRNRPCKPPPTPPQP